MLSIGILGGDINSLGGAKIWVVVPTCCILKVSIEELMITAGVSDPMVDTISSWNIPSSSVFILSVGNLEASCPVGSSIFFLQACLQICEVIGILLLDLSMQLFFHLEILILHYSNL